MAGLLSPFAARPGKRHWLSRSGLAPGRTRDQRGPARGRGPRGGSRPSSPRPWSRRTRRSAQARGAPWCQRAPVHHRDHFSSIAGPPRSFPQRRHRHAAQPHLGPQQICKLSLAISRKNDSPCPASSARGARFACSGPHGLPIRIRSDFEDWRGFLGRARAEGALRGGGGGFWAGTYER